MKRKHIITIVLLLLPFCGAFAQKVSFSTNISAWAYLGTVNLEASLGVSQHFSISVGGKLNPWEFQDNRRDVAVRDKRKTVNFGARYWPWYFYSGWCASLKGQYEIRQTNCVWRPALEESSAVGGVLSAGYAIMLGKHLDIDFGAGLFAGRYLDYTLYRCDDCAVIRQQGARNFLRLDDIMVSISVIF